MVGWWATWPAESVRGAVVSDHTCYHFLFDAGASGSSDPIGVTHPPELMDEISPLVRRPGDLKPEELARFVDVTPEDLARPFDFQDDLSHFKWALATAQSYRDIGLQLWKQRRPDVELVYVEGVDSTSHLFGHLFRRSELSGALAEQGRRYGRAVEEMYRYADEIVGAYLDALDDDTTLARPLRPRLRARRAARGSDPRAGSPAGERALPPHRGDPLSVRESRPRRAPSREADARRRRAHGARARRRTARRRHAGAGARARASSCPPS